MKSERRIFSLGIWGLAAGYFIFYLPYCALVKATTKGLLPGIEAPSPFAMLPATGLATAVVMLLIITAKGWWKYSGRVSLFGLSIPFPSRLTLISGIGTAAIIYTTTLVYTFSGVSILLAMLLLRAGVLLLAPAVDIAFKRRVRWFSWAALGLSLVAVTIAFSNVSTYSMSFGVVLTVGAYLTGYAVRLPCINKLAKSERSDDTYRYFVEEQMVAMFALIAIPAAIALTGIDGIPVELRHGFTSIIATQALWPSLMIGALYACLCFFGTRIYLDRRENTFCIPLNRCSSLLSVVAASYCLTLIFDQRPPGAGELIGASLITIAILLLSPLHHFRRQLARIERLLAESRLVYAGLVTGNVEVKKSGSPVIEASDNEELPVPPESEPVYMKARAGRE
jgi:hypothetical protein